MNERGSLWDAICRDVVPETASFDNCLTLILQNENHWISRNQALGFYASTSPSKDLRDASKKAAEMIDQAEINLYLHDGVYSLFNALISRYDTGKLQLTPEHLRFAQKVRLEFEKCGCGLPAGQLRESFRATMKQLKEYERQFQSNLNDDNTGIWLTESDLEGVPVEFIKRLRQGDGANEGQLWLSMKTTFFNQALKYAVKESTRRRAFTFYQNRLNDKNISLHRNMVLLKDQLARQLGYFNHAAMKVLDRMVDSPQAIISFLDEIRPALVAQGRNGVEKLLELKQKADPKAQHLFYWDRFYYQRISDEESTLVNFSDVSEYFEIHRTLQRLIEIYEHIFDIKFQQITDQHAEGILGSNAKYLKVHAECLVFSLWESKFNAFIGYMYFDLFPRDGKYTHRGHYMLQPGYTKSDGSRFYPSAAIVMNYTPPTDTMPCLLNMSEVRSLFHEMGHGLHNTLSVTTCARFHGTRVERDFVEAPSMMFEYFFWTPVHIKEVSCHYSHLLPQYAQAWRDANPGSKDLPPQQLPDEIVAALVQLKGSNNPFPFLTALHFASYDMTVHNPDSREALEAMNFCEIFNRSRNETTCLEGAEVLGEGWEWAHFESLFRHINGGGYDVGYYAYVMGRIWAIDIFNSAFKPDTRSKEEGLRYREMVLRKGGSQPAMKTLVEFLGRQPKPEVFYEWMGFLGSSKHKPSKQKYIDFTTKSS